MQQPGRPQPPGLRYVRSPRWFGPPV